MSAGPNGLDWFERLAVVAIVAISLGATAAFLLAPSPAPAPSPTGAGVVPTVYRNLTIQYDPVTGSYVYSSLQILVPANTRVIFTITNFDPSVAQLPNASDALVEGTLNGSMTVVQGGTSVTLGAVSTTDVSHTFTVHDGWKQLNIPIPPAQGAAAPAHVSFSLEFTVPGTYSWGCVVLCGGTAMTSDAGMYGSLTAS